MSYIANTDKDRKEMLEAIGVEDFSQLIDNIPDQFLLKELLNLEKPFSELELNKKVFTTLNKNKCLNAANSFLGGGVYDHFVPAAVDSLISRPEFMTAYTPYQAEVSQGTLQSIYEYQTLICELTGMEISNAGMYDGASATAEAVLMACRKNKLTKVLISETVNPIYLDVIKAYTEGVGIEIQIVTIKDGVTDIEAMNTLNDENTCCVVVQTPNYYGIIEDCFEIEENIKNISAERRIKPLFIVITDPIALPLLNAPSEYNADIVVGEGQALGNKPYYGGPLFGFLATKKDLARTMPGRIVGQTIDVDGKIAYTLTMQAREQHIRRDKATSNICSNQALCCLAGTIYMTLMGNSGMKEVAELCLKNSHYLAKEITQIEGYSMAYDQPFFKEFVVYTPLDPKMINEKLNKQNIYAGIDISTHHIPYLNNSYRMLIAVTEKKTKDEMDAFVKALKELI